MISIAVIIILSYLAGSLPTSIIAGKVLKSIDIREHGSGNAGATNVFRVLGWKAASVVGIIDLLKGFVATVYISGIAFGDVPVSHDIVRIAAGLSAVIGHIWTVFSGFKGGKGVLTVIGMFFGLSPVSVILCIAVASTVFMVTKYVSATSITGAVSLVMIVAVRKYLLMHDIGTVLFILTLLTSVLIIFTHRSNIQRLINGTEIKFSGK
ncbi:glycerol-3-phosphate 1-O-acyltransferase PlsY [candidate division KSB1 bacterium]|nr:glycerol-3-phosphate 1-O-acyltransferase PlsY [candidate division KSB1 bacterium]